MEISYQYVKLRRQFGRHPHFVDEGAELLVDLRPNEDYSKNWVAKTHISAAIQAAPDMSNHEVNTTAIIQTNKSVNHIEGGWPKEVDFTEAEQVIRYKKKIEKDEDYISTVVKLGSLAEEVIKQNNAIDIYEEYFADLPSQHLSEPPTAKTLTVLRDPSQIKRGAQAISWHPDGSAKLAAAYSIFEFQKQPDGMSAHSYVWDIHNPSNPDITLMPQMPLVSLAYNLKDHNIVGAGQYNGQFVFFDVRKGSSAVDSTPIEHSHRNPVHDFSWTQSKTGTELMSCSTDGSVLWWDLRKLGEPLESLILKEKGGDAVLAGVTVEYSPQAGPTKFMVGTEQGAILSGNRKAKNPQDRIIGSYSGHHGAIYSLVRNPTYPKFFLSIGDWTARIWNEDLKSPIVTTKYHSAYLTGGSWSHSRPGVFFTINSEGAMDAWDFYYKQKDPVLTVKVADKQLTAFSMQSSQASNLCGVGCSDSSITILHLSDGLVEVQHNEKNIISTMFERESNREKNLEKNAKEAKIKARKEAAKTGEPLDKVTADELQKLEAEFLKAVGVTTSS